MTALVYNLKDYEDIIFSEKLCNYDLPENTIKIISELNELFKGKTHHSTSISSQLNTQFNVYEKKKKKRDYGDSWGKEKNVPMPVKEIKSELEESISNIRSLMNKLSANNFDTTCDKIIATLESYKENMDNYDKVLTILFTISGNNQFFSEIYSKLHKFLVTNISNKEEYFHKVKKYIDDYIESTETIQYVESEKDYDKFCEYNKKNDIRKSNALFLMNLVKQDVISKTKYIEIIHTLTSIVKKKYDISIMVNQVEEITENIFLLLNKEYIECLKTNEDYIKFIEEIKSIGEYKLKEKAGLSTRAIFKYRTMCEYI